MCNGRRSNSCVKVLSVGRPCDWAQRTDQPDRTSSNRNGPRFNAVGDLGPGIWRIRDHKTSVARNADHAPDWVWSNLSSARAVRFHLGKIAFLPFVLKEEYLSLGAEMQSGFTRGSNHSRRLTTIQASEPDLSGLAWKYNCKDRLLFVIGHIEFAKREAG